jgi:hypothetical protein
MLGSRHAKNTNDSYDELHFGDTLRMLDDSAIDGP